MSASFVKHEIENTVHIMVYIDNAAGSSEMIFCCSRHIRSS